MTEQEIYDRLMNMKPGTTEWKKHIPEADHEQFLEIMKFFIREKTFWEHGFDISFSDDYSRFHKVSSKGFDDKPYTKKKKP